MTTSLLNGSKFGGDALLRMNQPANLRRNAFGRPQTRVGGLLIAGLLFSLLAAPAASAQNGSFLESLFRSIAEQKLQEEMSKRETDRGGRPPAPAPRPAPRPGDFPAGPLGPATPGNRPPPPSNHPRDDHRHDGPQTIRTSSREVRQFAEQLVQLDRELATLKEALQTLSRRDAGVRALLPETYQVQGLARTVLHQCDGANSLTPLRDPYRSLDQRWRELSFQVRSLPNRSDQLRSIVASCDQTGRKLSRQMGIEAQFDRHGLHDQMLIAATYMQALLDDVETARVSSDQARDLVHRGRLLREVILEEADRAETVQYDEIVSRFTDFVARWQDYANELASFRDPVLDRRLARIAQCGDQTYALLWMPPPSRPTVPGGGSRQDELSPRTRQALLSEAASLEGSAEYFRADLKRYARYLTPDSYERDVLRGTDRLYELAKKLHEDLDRRQPLDRLQRTASELAEVWEDLAAEISHIGSHGLTGRRADAIRQRFEQMLPMVGSLSAALLPTR
ncbi:hypothetical protein [Rhodopirellula sp. P2]|uniref:hypothetical protein n=1 Tax=Rhodopirellula sp. P2 TaxID=2127060 RepID=UPI002368AD4F|nr:hypothetical protein [Rhodopirellula sp. P2]WDQ16428.1 hypothetical protein PSR62_22800 [Rhodopirellula sp. P2]